jgi:hypothetical protein
MMTVRAGIGMKLRCLLAILFTLGLLFLFPVVIVFMLLRRQ